MGHSAPIPRLVITMGDPAGIGPEVIARAWTDERVHQVCRPVVVGHPQCMWRACQLVAPTVEVQPIQQLGEWTADPRRMPCLWLDGEQDIVIDPGRVDQKAGRAAYEAIMLAVAQLKERRADAIVTAPIHKAALAAAGISHPGHTELLAEQWGVRRFAMALHLPPEARSQLSPLGLTIVHVTLHVALRSIWQQLTTEAIEEKIGLADEFCGWLQPADPARPARIAVAALNPHGGESGLFGDEEARIIGPAVERALARGVHVQGPYPADTLMARALGGQFDAVVAMYHDQGHIPMKLVAMHHAVNVTLGLPIVRTSVAHGTAFDVAGQGRADARGMVHAILTGARLAARQAAARDDGSTGVMRLGP